MAKIEAKAAYYKCRSQGMTQKESAAAVSISERTARRWEREARESEYKAAAGARDRYAEKLIADQSKRLASAYMRLSEELETIDYKELSPDKKLDLALKYSRRMDELQNKNVLLPEALRLKIEAGAGDDVAAVELQSEIMNLVFDGVLTLEQGRKAMALVESVRKGITSAAMW